VGVYEDQFAPEQIIRNCKKAKHRPKDLRGSDQPHILVLDNGFSSGSSLLLAQPQSSRI
jgi:hypothetical protein